MKAVSEFIVRVFDLLEAEGRAARRAIFRLAGALLLLLGVAALLLTGLAFFLVAIYLVLADAVGAAGAFAILGGALLLASLAGAMLAHYMNDKKASVR
ncbi:MAG: hypothetical protein WD118_09375 [Phycisphaeraceae bacterium]